MLGDVLPVRGCVVVTATGCAGRCPTCQGMCSCDGDTLYGCVRTEGRTQHYLIPSVGWDSGPVQAQMSGKFANLMAAARVSCLVCGRLGPPCPEAYRQYRTGTARPQ